MGDLYGQDMHANYKFLYAFTMGDGAHTVFHVAETTNSTSNTNIGKQEVRVPIMQRLPSSPDYLQVVKKTYMRRLQITQV